MPRAVRFFWNKRKQKLVMHVMFFYFYLIYMLGVYLFFITYAEEMQQYIYK